MSSSVSAARALVDGLIDRGAAMAFGVPGESYLAVLDALHDVADRLPFITCRHEAAAANMAEACGKLTGTPGVAFVTRGPGATHASIGLHTALQDSTPMILFIGQVAHAMMDREAFQEIDYRRFLSEVTKWTGEVSTAERMAEYLGHAWAEALAGRQGPTALALPEDVQHQMVPSVRAHAHKAVQASPASSDVSDVAAMISGAKKPFILVGGGPWTKEAAQALTTFAEAHHIPLGTSFRCQSLIDNRSSVYAGHVGIGANPKLVARLAEADVVLAIGPRLGEMTTHGYSRFQVPFPTQTLVHVHAGASELGRVYQAARMINSSPAIFAEALAAEGVSGDWDDWGRAAASDEVAWRAAIENPGSVQLSQLYGILRDKTPDDTIVANGAGNYAAWLHRFFEYRGFKTQLAPTSGAMGYGVPAGIAAALLKPDHPSIAIAGDGCFMMSGNELATAVRYNAKTVFMVMNNGMYGTIRMHQERTYPERLSGTDLTNPDFVAYAKAFGLDAWRVEKTDEFGPALDRALAADGPALIEIMVDREAIAPSATLSGLRHKA